MSHKRPNSKENPLPYTLHGIGGISGYSKENEFKIVDLGIVTRSDTIVLIGTVRDNESAIYVNYMLVDFKLLFRISFDRS